MLKTIAGMLVGVVISAAVSAAIAVTGNPPVNGYGAVDGTWLQGLASGQNLNFQNGITAHAGGTAAAAFQLLPNVYLVEVDTVTTNGDSVALPQCVASDVLFMSNAGASTLDVYADPVNNSAVSPAAVDTINGTAGSTAYTLATKTNAIFWCAKNGNWSAIKGS